MIANLDYYLSACQLGITITSLGLGWLGEPTFEKLLHPLFDLLHLPDALTTTISFVISFIAVTYLHVVLGELALNHLRFNILNNSHYFIQDRFITSVIS